MPCITVSEFLKPLELKSERFPLPEWGPDAYVNIRGLGSDDLIALQRKHGSEVEYEDHEFLLDLISYCLVDDDGCRMFTTDAERDKLLSKSPGLLKRLGEAVVEVSGLAGERKNSPEPNSPSSDCVSGSISHTPTTSSNS